MKEIIFAGGIHGVGKSTLCREIASQLNLTYLSASDLLNWKDLNTDEKNKKVTDIPDTQHRLLKGLGAVVQPGKRYILDGHFCLFNKDNDVTPVPLDTFEGIAPEALVLVTGEAQEIASSLQIRDSRFYDPVVLSQMQQQEIIHARLIAKHLLIPLVIFDKSLHTMSNLIKQIHESLA